MFLFQVFVESVTILLLFNVSVFWPRGGGILALGPGTEQPLALEGNGPPGKSLCPGFNGHTVSGDEVKLGSMLR